MTQYISMHFVWDWGHIKESVLIKVLDWPFSCDFPGILHRGDSEPAMSIKHPVYSNATRLWYPEDIWKISSNHVGLPKHTTEA